MSTNTNAKAPLITLCNALAAGLQALPDTEFIASGQTLLKTAVITPLQTYVAATQQTAVTEAAWHASVQKEQAAEVAARAMIEEIKPVLQGRYGKSNPQLETQFGIAPVKKGQPSAATKAAAAAKAKATRALLGTKGSKQKKAAIAAATDPSAATPATPAPAAPPATSPATPPAVKPQ
ncbi:MAG TPA: hypothetical protein VIF09_21015 [Polyangiaceae bacterium]